MALNIASFSIATTSVVSKGSRSPGDVETIAFLEFPDLTFISFPGYNISYPSKGSMKLKMLLSIPKIVGGIKEEHDTLDKIIDDYTTKNKQRKFYVFVLFFSS